MDNMKKNKSVSNDDNGIECNDIGKKNNNDEENESVPVNDDCLEHNEEGEEIDNIEENESIVLDDDCVECNDAVTTVLEHHCQGVDIDYNEESNDDEFIIENDEKVYKHVLGSPSKKNWKHAATTIANNFNLKKEAA
eukprot:2679461-Ditylum_brightwellii.AAC.1